MTIQMVARRFELTEGIKNCITQTMASGVEDMEDNISRIRVVVDDINGPKGGNDKRCHVEMQIKNGHRFFLKKTGSDLYTVIHECGSTLRRMLHRHVTRVRDSRRRYSAHRQSDVLT